MLIVRKYNNTNARQQIFRCCFRYAALESALFVDVVLENHSDLFSGHMPLRGEKAKTNVAHSEPCKIILFLTLNGNQEKDANNY